MQSRSLNALSQCSWFLSSSNMLQGWKSSTFTKTSHFLFQTIYCSYQRVVDMCLTCLSVWRSTHILDRSGASANLCAFLVVGCFYSLILAVILIQKILDRLQGICINGPVKLWFVNIISCHDDSCRFLFNLNSALIGLNMSPSSCLNWYIHLDEM